MKIALLLITLALTSCEHLCVDTPKLKPLEAQDENGNTIIPVFQGPIQFPDKKCGHGK